jgi:hypothetical protein
MIMSIKSKITNITNTKIFVFFIAISIVLICGSIIISIIEKIHACNPTNLIKEPQKGLAEDLSVTGTGQIHSHGG